MVTEINMLDIPQHGVGSRRGKPSFLPASVQESSVSRNLGCTVKGRRTGITSRRADTPFPTFQYDLEMEMANAPNVRGFVEGQELTFVSFVIFLRWKFDPYQLV